MSHPLQQKIAALRSRVWRLVMVYALAWVVATVLGGMVVLGLLDYLIRFEDRGIRVICSLLVLGMLGWTCYRYVYLVWIVRVRDVDLAGRLQRRFPALEDRLISAVEFLRQPEDDPVAGSAALRRAVIAQTTAETDRLDFREVLDPGPPIRAAMVTVAVCLTAAILVVVRPLDCQIAVARLVNPLGEQAWPRKTHLRLRRPVSRVAKGQPFEVEVVDTDKAARLPLRVHIHYRFEGPDAVVTEESEPMRLVDGAMVARRENVVRPFSYRASGGDDDSMPWIPVEVVEPPRIESLSITLIPPKYTGWPPERTERHVRALVGTQMRIAAKATKPLSSAVLCLDGPLEIPGRIGQDRYHFTVGGPSEGGQGTNQKPAATAAAELVIEESGTYWFRLTDDEGLSGGGDPRWEIRAVPDTPPTVSIEEPLANLFVTPQAVVPLRVAAKDDLAVGEVTLTFGLAGEPRQDGLPQEAAGEDLRELPLYAGPEQPEPRPAGALLGAELGDRRVIEHAWELEGLGLQAGDQLSFHATATDYRPQAGTSEPRRLVVITPEELQDRLAGRQGLILAELARVLEMQRGSRSQVESLKIRLAELGHLEQLDVDHLQAAELSQRQVGRSLTSRSEGVPVHVLALLADLQNNRVDSPDLERRMQGLLGEMDRLGRQHLPIIGRELTAAIKAAQVRLQQQPPPDKKNGEKNGEKPSGPDVPVAASLSEAGDHQDQVIASLQQLLDQLAQWNGNYRRFYREVGQLLRDQQGITGRTTELGVRTLTKQIGDLQPQERADLKVLAGQQFELVGRLDRVLRGMEQAVDPLQQSDPLAAETVADALDAARRLSISGQMRTARGHLQRNRIGQAAAGQKQIARDLKEVLDVLANRRQHELARLVEKLQEAQAELAEIERQQAGLREQLQAAAEDPDDPQHRDELQRLAHRQEQLQKQTQRMARRLERLTADQAGRTTERAAAEMAQAGQCAGQGDCQGASQRAEEARKTLEEAGRQLAERLQQARAELAMEHLARLEDALKRSRRQQQDVLDETEQFDRSQAQERLTRTKAAALRELARRQRSLQLETVELGDPLMGAGALHLALSGAAGEMGRAAGRLDRRQTGADTQEAQKNALKRLDLLLEALKPEAPDEDANDPAEMAGGAGGGAGEGQGGAADAMQTLLELKLLKLLQEEIGLRTGLLEQAVAGADALTDQQRTEYARLSAEQGQLADLVSRMLPSAQEEPGGDPAAAAEMQDDLGEEPPPRSREDELP